MIETAAVYALTLLVIAGGIYAALVRHTLFCIIGLGVSLFGVAGLFLYLGSPFVAAMQVLIYIGGITIAMIFAMMLSLPLAQSMKLDPAKLAASLVAALAFFAAMAWLIVSATFPIRDEPAPREQWAVGEIGHAFLTTYNLVFEGLSLILMLAIVSAILVAKEQKKTS